MEVGLPVFQGTVQRPVRVSKKVKGGGFLVKGRVYAYCFLGDLKEHAFLYLFTHRQIRIYYAPSIAVSTGIMDQGRLG